MKATIAQDFLENIVEKIVHLISYHLEQLKRSTFIGDIFASPQNMREVKSAAPFKVLLQFASAAI